MKRLFGMAMLLMFSGLGLAQTNFKACELVLAAEVTRTTNIQVSQGVATAPKAQYPTSVCTFSAQGKPYAVFTITTYPNAQAATNAAKAMLKNPVKAEIGDMPGVSVWVQGHKKGFSGLYTAWSRYLLVAEVAVEKGTTAVQLKALTRVAYNRIRFELRNP